MSAKKISNMKKLIYILSLSLLVFSCDEDFEEINSNENNPENITLDVAIVSAETLVFERFGQGYDRYAGAFTQHFSGNHATGIDMDQYNLRPSDFNNTWTFAYNWALMDNKQMIDLAKNEDSWHYVGVGQVMTALMLGYLTDIYGDVPYSDALGGSLVPTPEYDTQQEIYSSIQLLLDSAIINFDRTSEIPLGASDIAYSGDLDSWKAISYFLKARYYNHLSKMDPMNSATNALDALSSAYDLGFTTEMDLQFSYDGSATHQNPWYTLWENNLIIASENFMDLLLTTNDPRIHAYWDSVSVDGTNVGLVGKSQGYGTDSRSYSPVGPEGFFGRVNSPVLIATYFEAKFIEAEANLRLGNEVAAASAHNDAVSAQIAKVVSDADGLAMVNSYLADYGSETAITISMDRIMEEKYKAMFTQGIESWVDVRRHDYQYPSYLAIPEDQLNGAVATEFIRRVPYPQNEVDFNASNIPDIADVFQSLWWDN